MADYCKQCSTERGSKHNDMIFTMTGLCEGCKGQKFNFFTGICIDPDCKIHGKHKTNPQKSQK